MTSDHDLTHPGHSNHLVDLLRFRAAEQSDFRGFIFLPSGEDEEQPLTYGELDLQARRIAAKLQQLGAAGQRVVLLFPPGLSYVAAFFGCLYAGAVAVPAYPPLQQRHLPRLLSLVEDARPVALLTTSQVLMLMQGADAAPPLRAIPWLAVDDLPAELAADWRPPVLVGDSLAMLQYTSGSTDEPRGVMITHRNLLHNSHVIRRWLDHGPGTVGMTWLPPYHDMGLIGTLLQPLYAGFPVVILTPFAFLQRPLRWLSAISRMRATITGAPNFAYDLCLRRSTEEQRQGLDLSCLEVAFCGAEPVRADTLERFATAFAPHGFRREAFFPCYGLAEATLNVSGRPRIVSAVDQTPVVPLLCDFASAELEAGRVVPLPADTPREGTRKLVSSGPPAPDLTVRIVDPETLEPCPPNRIGEIWVSGQSIASGYFERPQETAATFQAHLGDEGPFLRTGDLGFLHAGELFVACRLKDMILIDGRNHYPQDIEHTVERAHQALRHGCSAAFSIEQDDSEQLVVTAEIQPTAGIAGHNAESEVVAAIRRAVTEHHGLRVHAVALLQAGSLPKTSSGKVQRRASRSAYLTGQMTLWR